MYGRGSIVHVRWTQADSSRVEAQGVSGQDGWFIMERRFLSNHRLSQHFDLLEPGFHHGEPRSLLPVVPLWFEHGVRGWGGG